MTRVDKANEEPAGGTEKANDYDPADKFNDALGLSTDIIEHAIGVGADAIENGAEVGKEMGKKIVDGLNNSPVMKGLKEVEIASDLYDVYGAAKKAFEEPTIGNIGKAIGKAAWVGISNFTPVGRAASIVIDVGSGILDLFDLW